jgi:hypothetical protein
MKFPRRWKVYVDLPDCNASPEDGGSVFFGDDGICKSTRRYNPEDQHQFLGRHLKSLFEGWPESNATFFLIHKLLY